MRNNINLNTDYAFRKSFEGGIASNGFSSTKIRRVEDKAPFQEKVSNQVLAALPSAELAKLLSLAKRIDFSAGESVFQPGDKIRYVYFPETAVFSEFDILQDGKTCEIAMIGKEGFVGLPVILDSATADRWTEVSLGGSALRINSDIFQNSFTFGVPAQMKMNQYLNYYIKQISQRVVCNCYHQIKERFCCWLLMLQDRKECSEFSLTQEQIARLMGINRPSLSYIAKEIRDDNLINYSRGKITILDREKLENSACSCYAEKMKEAFSNNGMEIQMI
ncbi:MAG TPA: Crp/Fnr family transcriptional regulator [Pyrinomonadaceae bacterium]|nr:Crp/Fnr family transcriptional regulator [Pyrinomonadaceae bacterium]